MDIATGSSRPHPFAHEVDADVFCRTPIHERAREALVAAATTADLLILLGEPGTGKTAVLHRVVCDLEQAGARVLLSSALRPPHEMFRPPGGAPSVMGASFHGTLRSRVRSERATVVAVDDAERLTLTELRFFRDLVIAERQIGRRLTILLVGRPAFDVKVAHLRAEAGGIVASRVPLMPLDAADVSAYMACRLQHAGWRLEELFEPEAVERVVAYAEGLPRRVNQLCYAALHTAIEAGLGRVAASSVQAAADWLDFRRLPSKVAAGPGMAKWARGLATAGVWVRPAAGRVGAMAVAAGRRARSGARTGADGIAVAATRRWARATGILGVALATIAHGLGHAAGACRDAMGAVAQTLVAMVAATGRGLARAAEACGHAVVTTHSILRTRALGVIAALVTTWRGLVRGAQMGARGIAAAGATLRAWTLGVATAVATTSRSLGHAARAGARGVVSAEEALRRWTLSAAAAAAAVGRGIGRSGWAGVQGVAAATTTLRRGALDAAAAAVALGNGIGRRVRSGADRVVTAAAMLSAWAGSSVHAGLAMGAAGVGRGLAASGRGAAAATGTLWAWSRGVASGLAAASRHLGGVIWAGGRRVGSAQATLRIRMRRVIAATAAPSGRALGRAGSIIEHRLGLAYAMLGIRATNLRAWAVTAGHRVGRVVRLGVERMALAATLLGDWMQSRVASVTGPSRAPGRSISARVPHHAAWTSLRTLSPGAVVAALSLVVFTLVMTLWPMSYEPPTAERPPPLDLSGPAVPPAVDGVGPPPQPSSAEGKRPVRAVARSGMRPSSPSVSRSVPAREPITFATPRPPSDR